MHADDETRILRRRQDELSREGSVRRDANGLAPSALLVTVTKTSYPTAAGKYYAVRRVRVGGTEAEGATPTLAAFGPTFFAANTGGSIPPSGTYVLGTLADGRWAFNYG